MTTIKVNLTNMFSHREPWDCSNSAANLGDQAGRLTWECALEVTNAQGSWLECEASLALDAIRDWARDTGAWDREEIEAREPEECLALLVQNVASDLRAIGTDDKDLEELIEIYSVHCHECAYIVAMYVEGTAVYADLYFGG